MDCLLKIHCINYNYKCDACNATSDIYNHHPYYSTDVPDYFDFLERFEYVSVSKGLFLCMQRAPVGCGIHFFFKDPNTSKRSMGITLMMYKNNYNDFFARLEAHADDFLEELKKEVPSDG